MPRIICQRVASAACFVFLLALSTGVMASGDLENPAERWATDGSGGAPSFVKHVVPLLNKAGCSTRSCHGSFQGQNGFRLSLFGYDPQLDHRELVGGEDEAARIDVKRPDSSLAWRKPLLDIEHEGQLAAPALTGLDCRWSLV